MIIKNRPFNPDLLIKTTLPEESGDTVSYEYRHCDMRRRLKARMAAFSMWSRSRHLDLWRLHSQSLRYVGF